jgi:hypothetical protein
MTILRLRMCGGNNRTCHLFPFRLRLLILPFRGTLEALQGTFYAGSDSFRAKCFEEPTPPTWGEDEVSAILDATGGRVDGSAGDVCFLLQSHWEKNMQVELVSFGIDRFDLEDEVQGAAKGFSSEGDGLAYGGWTFWLKTFYLDIGPLGIPFPSYEVPPDHLDRRRDDCDGTDGQAHSMFLLSISGLRQGIIYASNDDGTGPVWPREAHELSQAAGGINSASKVIIRTARRTMVRNYTTGVRINGPSHRAAIRIIDAERTCCAASGSRRPSSA